MSSSWFSAPVFVAATVTDPLGTLPGAADSETIIAEPPPIIPSPRSESVTFTADPGVARGSQFEAKFGRCVP
jgi:hypothetical protein